VADECNKYKKDSQQQVLFRIFTEFPFHSFEKTPQELLIALAKVCQIFFPMKEYLFFFIILELFKKINGFV